jgi:hypothetical protein
MIDALELESRVAALEKEMAEVRKVGTAFDGRMAVASFWAV